MTVDMNLKSLLTSTRFLWLGLILLIAAILLEPEREEASLQEVKPAHIEKILAHRIRELENESKILLDSLAGRQPDQVFLAHDKEIRQLCDDDRIALFLFHQDSLIMWSDHSLALEEHWLSRMVPKTMVKLPNAWVYTDVFTKGDYRIVGMVPVKRIYPYENNYIHNHFLFDRAVPSVYEISTIPRKGALQINGPGETFLFYLIPHPVHDRLSFLFWLDSILYILSLFFYLALLADLLRNGYRLYKSNWWLIALLADLVLVRWILFYFNIPGILVHTSLFKPLNTPVSFLHSHGDILLTVVFILFFSYQVFKLLRIWPVNPARRRQLMDNRRITDAIGIGVWVAVLMLFLGTEWIINNVLTGHDHMLEIYRILTIDKYVLVDVGAEIVLHVSILLIVIRVVRQLSEVMSTRRLLRGFVPAVTVIYGVTRFAGWGPDWFSIIYLIIVVVILVLLMHQPGKKITPVWTVVLLMLLSAHAVQHIYFANQTKESGIQKKIIQDLANEHDPVAEMLLAESSPGIQNDTILSRMIIRQTPRSDRVTVEQHVTDYLRSNYFDHYWTRYQIQANICDSVNLLMLSPDNIEVPCLNHYTLDILKPMGQKLPGTDFYYIDNFDGLINYLGVFR
ncbi:MAG: hypothetical protein J7L89_03560, partial [Bacteroidales bacterium]|nr:hypothetical protein [Bacteroidales bacterium]